MKIFDTETCGLHSVMVLLQYCDGLNGKVKLFECWKESIKKNLKVIEEITNDPEGIVGFNLAFDWYHMCKWYSMLKKFIEVYGEEYLDQHPEDFIHEFACIEKEARDMGCLKPVTAVDLMMVARRGPYQATMERSPVIIKRVPNMLAEPLSKELYQRIPLKDIYFARSAKGERHWSVLDHKDRNGNIDPEFKNVVLSFAPSGGLKAIYADLFKKKAANFEEVQLGSEYYPEELGYAPFAEALAPNGPSTKNWKMTWPTVLKYHIAHWNKNKKAREYAVNDVVYTRDIYVEFGEPPMGDTDSILTCAVAACRWRGFKVNIDKLKALREKRVADVDKAPRDSKAVLRWFKTILSREEFESLKNSTNKQTLENLVTWTVPCDCVSYDQSEYDQDETSLDSMSYTDFDESLGAFLDGYKGTPVPDKECKRCAGLGTLPHPIAGPAKAVTAARTAKDEQQLFDKLILADRLHASYKVYGTLSGRMSGADGLNVTGIKRSHEIRECFDLAWDDLSLQGGDFDSFEIFIAVALYNDERLMEDVSSGKVIHALFAQALFPDMTYDDIMKSHHDDENYEIDMYDMGKRGIYSQMYGGNEGTLMNRLGVSEEIATQTTENFYERYAGVGRHRDKIFDMFCSMRQPNGLRSPVIWNDPAEYIESGLGSRRYYTLENMITKALFEIAENPPEQWQAIKQTVQRRHEGRPQTVCGATRSAIFAAAFAVQAAAMRSAGNHEIQNLSGTITKILEKNLWDLQPSGYHDFQIMVMNVHDEIMAPCKPDLVDKAKQVQEATLEEYKSVVPLISMDWGTLETWASK